MEGEEWDGWSGLEALRWRRRWGEGGERGWEGFVDNGVEVHQWHWRDEMLRFY